MSPLLSAALTPAPRPRLRHTGWLALPALWGCHGAELPDPVITGVEPASGYSGEDTTVRVTGVHFLPELQVGTEGGAEPVVHAGFGLRLSGEGGSAELVGVSLEDFSTLWAVVPAGIVPGLYDLVLTGPTGRVDVLEEAFVVTSTRAERLSVDADQVVWTVQQSAALVVELVDPEGDRVLDDLEVVVEVEDTEGSVSFLAGSLENQRAEGPRLVGSLGDDGIATVGLSIDTPGVVRVVARPANERSGIAGGDIKLQWEPGADTHLEIGLPSVDFSVPAGEPFPLTLTLLDAFGNLVDDPVDTVLLRDGCGSLLRLVSELGGEQELWVQVSAASGTGACPSQHIETFFGPVGRSADFQVLPGEPVALALEVSPDEVVAGEALEALVSAVDAWGNRAEWTAGSLQFTDSEGGVVGWSCLGSETRFCEVQAVVAGEAVTLQADAAGLFGSSLPYRVVPAAAAEVALIPGEGRWTAGADHPLAASVRDRWGNALGLDAVPGLAVRDALGEVRCGAPAGGPDTTAALECALFTAGDRALWGEVPGLSLLAPEVAVGVDNGPVATVAVTPALEQVVAGEPLPVHLRAADAWGNPWAVHSDPTLTLWDARGVGGEEVVAADASGEVDAVLTLTLSGAARISAGSDGVVLGQSGLVTVLPGDAVALVPSLAAPWVWVGEAVDFSVQAQDLWGNRALVDATLSLCPGSDLGCGTQVVMLDGAASGRLSWAQPELSESLWAQGAGLAGQSEDFAVVQACEAGPTLVVRFPEHGRPVACWDPDADEASLPVSLSWSTAGDAGLVLYGRSGPDGVSLTGEPGAIAVLDAVGAHTLRFLVVDAAGCAAEGASEAWAAWDDGEPAGPVPLAADAGGLSAGGGELSVVVGPALDCAGAPAAGGAVRARVDAGALVGATPTGAGLSLTLDDAGRGALSWDATGVLGGDWATLSAWTPEGAGALTLPVTGDLLRPVVWEQDPVGDTLDTVDSLTLRLSEEVSAAVEDFGLVGPYPVEVVEVSAAGPVLTVALSPPLDGAAGHWELTVSREVRDRYGIRLDGALIGQASDYVGHLGDLPAGAEAAVGCALDRAVFRPDGDPGVGDEADEALLAWGAEGLPASWRVRVRDDQGGLIRQERLPGVAASFVWDGRDHLGAVAPDGAYSLQVAPVDGFGNQGPACEAGVRVDNGRTR